MGKRWRVLGLAVVVVVGATTTARLSSDGVPGPASGGLRTGPRATARITLAEERARHRYHRY